MALALLVPLALGLFIGNKLAASSLYLTERRRPMNFITAQYYRVQATEARPGVIDHSDLYVLLFGLTGVIVAFICL
jgi:hypothetical protein